jgi:hypothetical protein
LDDSSYDSDFLFVLKVPSEDNRYEIDFDNLHSSLYCATIRPNYLKALVSNMPSSFIPFFMEDQTWPDNAKKEFMG